VSRPTVGITTSTEEIVAAGWDETAAFSPLSYVRAVQRAGARAVLLVPDDDPEGALGGLDAVIVSGGASDVSAQSYGAPPHPQTRGIEPRRDAFEIALVRAGAEQGVPVLGICRGMQIVNVAYGGTLTQHMPDVLGRDEHRVPAAFADHEVELAPGSLAARAVGRERERVKSHHHQGVENVGAGLAVSGTATIDGTVEAIEDADGRYVLGVLWHPEEDEASRVISALVESAGGYK
jgi:putative glutamine amidotransferase